VKKTLGSVRRICEAGNRVVCDEDGSYVENKSNGERTALIEERGSYVLTLWVPRESGSGHMRLFFFSGWEHEPWRALSCKAREG
jgi:hypothetical protein